MERWLLLCHVQAPVTRMVSHCQPVLGGHAQVSLGHQTSSHPHTAAGLDAKQRGHGEDLVTLAVTRLLQGHALDLHGLLPSALFVLEAAQATRTSSAPLRLHAAALYALLGCPRAAAMQLEALGVKQILHDSMTAHWLLPALLDSGATAAAGEALDTWVWLGCWTALALVLFLLSPVGRKCAKACRVSVSLRCSLSWSAGF